MPPSIRDAVPELRRVLVVVAGGLVGAAGRIAVSANVSWQPGGWPAGTLLVNIVGAALVAAFVTRRQRAVTVWWALDFWAIGVLGSLTTFSALGLETFQLLDAGRVVAGIGYAVASPILGVSAAWAATWIARRT